MTSDEPAPIMPWTANHNERLWFCQGCLTLYRTRVTVCTVCALMRQVELLKDGVAKLTTAVENIGRRSRGIGQEFLG